MSEEAFREYHAYQHALAQLRSQDNTEYDREARKLAYHSGKVVRKAVPEADAAKARADYLAGRVDVFEYEDRLNRIFGLT